MNEQPQTVFPAAFPSTEPRPDNGSGPVQAPAGTPVMLEGMKVMFDDKVGLYPVDLVAKTPPRRMSGGTPSGQLGRTRPAARR